MLLQNKYNISDRIIWIVAGICALPLLLHLVGVNFSFVNRQLNVAMIDRLVELENQEDFLDIMRGRYIHTIFVSFSIAIALLTIILAFIDYRIKGELSTPIVGVALFCSGLFYTFHILVSTNLLHVPQQQFYLTSFTWFFCRLFHASILIFGVSIFLVQSKPLQLEISRSSKRVVSYITVLFVLITCITITLLFLQTYIPRFVFPYRNIARQYDLIPLSLYLFSAFYILPKFYEKYPSVFSQTLLLSMIPAIATQLYMAFGSEELFDNNFNISHLLTAITYFIPFIGLSLNYLQTHRNERKVIRQLNHEAHERKAAEEILSSVLNSSLSSIMSFRSVRNKANKIVDFKWTLANPASNTLFGLNYREVAGKNLHEVIPGIKKEGWLEMFIYVVETGEPLNQEYYSEYFQKWLLVIGVRLEDGLAVTINDISKRKNALQELMSAEKLAVTGRLARTIAHEVRNPLTNINLSIQQLKVGDIEEKEMFLDIVERNSRRINQLITELLNSSKPAELVLSRHRVNQLLDETLELAIDRIKLKEIKLEKNFASGTMEIEADADKIKTAFLNIIINAIEAMEQGKGCLKISSAKELQQCVITIEDNGSGIDSEHLKRLFEPFFSQKSGGMGLGLTATQNIILSHKGIVDVQSLPGKGTRFILTFQLV